MEIVNRIKRNFEGIMVAEDCKWYGKKGRK